AAAARRRAHAGQGPVDRPRDGLREPLRVHRRAARHGRDHPGLQGVPRRARLPVRAAQLPPLRRRLRPDAALRGRHRGPRPARRLLPPHRRARGQGHVHGARHQPHRPRLRELPGQARGARRRRQPRLTRAAAPHDACHAPRTAGRDRLGTVSRPRTFLESWSRRSAPERFDTYTRGSLYFPSAFEPFFALSILGADPTFDRDLVLPWLLVVVAHTTACVALLRAGISQFLGGPPVRPWLGTAAVVLTVALVVVAVPTFPVGDGDEGAVAGRFFAVLLGVMPLLAAASPLLLFRHLLLAVLGATLFTVGATVATAAAGGTDPSRTSTLAGVAVSMGLATFFMAVGIVGSYQVSIWMLGVVWEQDRTRVLHARLAVAEERLRFSRDLHDVFGRTLSVVAVKSELAAELAARGRPGAEEQMLEVRRIAQDALREVRAVVAGYRSANLGAELAGARSVLRSAGITTTVH